MNAKSKLIFLILCAAGAVTFITLFVLNADIAVFDPKGWVAGEQRDLMRTAVLLMLVVVVPVLILAFTFAWKYRAGNAKAKYAPDLDHNTKVTLAQWGIPILVICVLAVVTWNATHALDPSKPLLRQGSGGRALTIQGAALRWKWLFIYPEQNIATVNFVQFPERTPISFELTADAPMNSFWIPQLGGQMYAMEGMVTKLHLMADAPGEFAGSSAEISGKGFAGMKFIAKASSQEYFDAWVASVKQSGQTLDLNAYNELAKPSENNLPTFYASAAENLRDMIVMKFMPPKSEMQVMEH